MLRSSRLDSLVSRLLRAGPVLALGACMLAAGCHKAPPARPPAEAAPRVRLEPVARRDLRHVVEQPGYVSAFEQTSLFPKVTGYIKGWNGTIDIGTRIKENDVLATISVPELDAELKEKKSLVVRDQKRLEVARRLVKVAKRNLEVCLAETKQALAKVREAQASVERWEVEVKRLDSAARERAVNPEVFTEAVKQLQAEKAAYDAAEAFAEAARARELSHQADVDKTEAERDAAEAQVVVDEDAVRRLEALVEYEKIRAPYDGIVVVRNVNNGDFVEPRYGDESAPLSGKESETPVRGTPLYVVARMDRVRIFVDVPEVEANYVGEGTRGRVRIPAHEDFLIEGKVVRHSWALDVRSRTRRVEIDLDNPDGKLLPGMYAVGIIDIERKGVWALPRSAVMLKGNQNTCYLFQGGKAVETPVQTGLANDEYIEVLQKQVKGKWTRFTGAEQVILGELAQLRDGEKVRVVEPEGAPQDNRVAP